MSRTIVRWLAACATVGGIILAGGAVGQAAQADFSGTASPTAIVSGGSVDAVAVSGSTAYLAGTFTHVGGTPTGSFVELDGASGQVQAGLPLVATADSTRPVLTAPDGAGGWYVAGASSVGAETFTSGGGETLAHIRADGSVDPNWKPTVDGYVLSIAASATTVYLGGGFGLVNGSVRRGNVVALDPTTAAVKGFDAQLGGGMVTAIALSDSTLYVGGLFSTVNGSIARNHLAAFDATTGTVTDFDPNIAGSVSALAVSGSTVYVGGNGLAAFDATTGAATGFNPGVVGMVSALAVSGTTVYAGGSFGNELAAFDAVTGAPTSFYPSISGDDPNSRVWSIAVSGSTVYACGSFSTVNGSLPRDNLAAFDASTGTATSFTASPGGRCTFVGAFGSHVFIAGAFNSIGGVRRNGLAAIDLANGQVTGFDPNLPGNFFSFRALAVSGSTVYVGGGPTGFAALDADTGTPTGGDLQIYGTVEALAVSGSTLYAGGYFSTVNGSITRNNLAAFDTATGAATGFDPNVSGMVSSLAVTGSTVYAGGYFSTVNGATARNNLAAFDAATGAATSFDPNMNGGVAALVVTDSTLYAGGYFTTVNGSTTRNNLAAFDAATGTATSFDPNVNGQVAALLATDSGLYAGGYFSSVNGSTTRNGLAGFDRARGAATGWDPNPSAGVNALALGARGLSVGGQFTTVGGGTQFVGPFAQFASVNLPLDTTPPAITVPGNQSVPATSPAGVTVAFQASATDAVDGPVPVTCAPPPGSVFPINPPGMSTQVVCTASDKAGNTATATFAVHVRGAGEQLAELGDAVKGVGPGKNLAATIAVAQWFLAHHQIHAACLTLTAFNLEVKAQSGRKIPTAQATALIADANRIRAVLGC